MNPLPEYQAAFGLSGTLQKKEKKRRVVCRICQHPKRKEIEKEIIDGVRNIGKKWGFGWKEIYFHKVSHMSWNTSLIIVKSEFCEICLEKNECQYDHDLKVCKYWREYCEDTGREA